MSINVNNVEIFGTIKKDSIKINSKTLRPIIYFELINKKKLKNNGLVDVNVFSVEVFGNLSKAIIDKIHTWEDVIVWGELREDKKKKFVKIVATKIIPVNNKFNSMDVGKEENKRKWGQQ